MTDGDIGASTRPGGRVAVVAGGATGWLPPRVLAPWLSDPDRVQRVRWMSEVTGLDLIHLGTVAGQHELSNPALSQPLATALQILAGEPLVQNLDPADVLLAGYGTGEIATAVLAGVLEPEAGLGLAVRIGRAQARAASAIPGGQVALLGGYPAEIERRSAESRLSIAAYNGGGAIVVAGPQPTLEELMSTPPRHTRAERLPAIGGFGSELMVAAADVAREMLTERPICEPRVRLLSGRDGCAATSGISYAEGIVSQLTGAVRWDLIMDGFARAEVRLVMELPPAGALTSLVARGMPGVNVVPLRDHQTLAEMSTHRPAEIR